MLGLSTRIAPQVKHLVCVFTPNASCVNTSYTFRPGKWLVVRSLNPVDLLLTELRTTLLIL